MDVDQPTKYIVVDCKFTNWQSGTAHCLFRSLSDLTTHRTATIDFQLHPTRLNHRFPLFYAVPHETTAPGVVSACTVISSALLYYKLLRLHTETKCFALIDSRGQFTLIQRTEFDFAKHCVCDVLFLDNNDTANFYCDWKTSVGDDAAWLVAPCVCNPDAFLMHANLDRDDDGQPLFYQPSVRIQRIAHRSAQKEFELLRPLFAELARHKLQWIQERNLLGHALELVQCTGQSLREVLQSGATAFADAIIELTWMRQPHTTPKPEPCFDTSASAASVGVLLEGGTVLDAQLGFHSGLIVMLDASSLYPSVVLQYALDPLLCAVYTSLLQARAAATNRIRNRALKLLMNSIYGSRLFGLYKNPQLAAKITAGGRAVLEEARRLVTEYNGGSCVIVAGDTDGLAIKCAAATDCDALLQLLNSRWQHIKFKIDRKLSVLVQLTKKTWFGRDFDTGARLSKGTEDVKSNCCAFAKRVHVEWQTSVIEQHAPSTMNFLAVVYDELLTQTSLSELVCHPKPTKTHRTTERAFVYCTVATGPARNVTQEVPLARLMDISHVDTDYTLDLEKLFKLQIRDPIIRYAEVLEPKQ